MKHKVEQITPETFAEIAALVQQRTGLVLTGHQGTAEKSGFTVQYRYTPAARTLELELIKKPWFVPQSLVDSKIAEYMKKEGQAFLDRAPGKDA